MALPVARSRSARSPEDAPDSTRYESVLEHGTAEDGLSTLLADVSRRTRTRVAVEAPQLSLPLVEVGAGVAGPLLTGYVLWCLRRAHAAGCRRLYFVARDGEVLLRIARRLLPATGLDLDLRYLEGSRLAWLLPGTTEVDATRVAAVAGRGETVTVRSLLAWVALPPEAVAPALVAAGLPPTAWDAPLARSRIPEVLALLEEPAVAPLVLEGARAARTHASRYLRQVGLLDDEPWAVVDMEGHGNTGQLLARLLLAIGGRAPDLELYFALTSPTSVAGRRAVGYLWDDGRSTGRAERDGDVHIALEVFTAGTHGQVRSYDSTLGRARPVLAEQRNEAALAWGLEGLRRVLDVFADELATSLRSVDPWADVRLPTWGALRAFWTRPTREEVSAWGSFRFSADDGLYAIAQGFTSLQVLRSIVERRPRMRRRSTWPAGVLATAPLPVRLLHAVKVRSSRLAVRRKPPRRR